jgi:acetoin utilization protein AcuB
MTTTKNINPTAKTTAMTTAMMLVAKKQVKEWMSPNPVTVLPTAHVDEAFRLMAERHIRRLPVTEGGALVGIVTLGDLRSLGADTDSDEPNKIRVDAALHTNPITVTPDTPLVDAARLMIQHKFSGLPVLSASDQSLVGIITESDILRAFIADEAEGQAA